MSGYSYSEYSGGPDPLAPPYDVRSALDQLGQDVLNGESAAGALRDLLRRGLAGDQGLRGRGMDDLLRQVRERQREIRERGRLDGILDQARALLDTAVGQERAELFPDPGDDARMREAELDTLPADTAQAIRRLADYQWRSPAARDTFDKLKDLLRREVLDSQFRGMKQALQEGPDEASMQRVRDMLASLNEMLAADARGEHTQADFDRFMEQYSDLFPDNPRDLEQLVDSLVRRIAAAQRLLESLSADQRGELAGLMSQALEDAGLAAEMARLADALRARRPDLDMLSRFGDNPMTGEQPLGLGDATSALAELADLADLETSLRQDYPGARLDDVDEEAVRRALGRQAVDDMAALKEIERELERQGYLRHEGGSLGLTPKAVRRLGETALRQVFAQLGDGGPGEHEQHDAGQAGDPTGSTRPWQFGDELAIDAAATVRSALLREARTGHQVRLSAEDFMVTETEQRVAAAVCLLVDLSYSMALRGTWGAAKQTALALHALVRSRFPQDAIQVIGFSNYARELRETDLAGLGWDMVQGTNLHHALVLAGRYLDKHPEHDPVVLVVTDGEPTAHLQRDGRYWFDWPPSPETLELTLAEVDKMTRRGAALNIFMLAEDERLTAFVEDVARRNGGRLLQAVPERLGEYVVQDFLRTRRQHSRR
ncbi:MAG TPA: hypothetical protein VHY58_24115 [Streptosporangiaceae bacterium]|jgi:uncharacterized protein with von Willebrand factor type A (vWA) domain|nr:hypothetical protein [Streptosporangiaceae bacterium]